MIKAIISFLSGGIMDTLAKAYEAKLNAANDEQRIEAEKEIERIEASVRMAQVANDDRWSATSLGRYLIVVPFGLWWTAIYLVQIINPWFGLELVVIDVPPHIMDMARILVPAIVIADAGALTIKRIKGF